MNPAIRDIARMIDHSVLHPKLTDRDLEAHCALARKFGAATVCVKPYHVSLGASLVKGSQTGVCAVAGFPHGNSKNEIKTAEAEQAISDGATEVDMVVNIGKVLEHDWKYIHHEINAINEACIRGGALLKVIFETDYVSRDEDKIELCRICNDIRVGFVKTSTGFGFVPDGNGKYSYTGATDHDIVLMRKYCHPEIGVKAAGGIRTLDRLLRVRELGATRVGATATDSILEEARRRFGK